jgi:hypothetical protein
MTTLHTNIGGSIVATQTLDPNDPVSDIWTVTAQVATGNNDAFSILFGGETAEISLIEGASIHNRNGLGRAFILHTDTQLFIGAGSSVESGALQGVIVVGDDTELSLVNHGVINGYYGISTDSNAQNQIVNYGEISAIHAAYLARSGSAAGLAMENYGIVRTLGGTGVVLDLSSADDSIQNSGIIQGRIKLYGGTDTITNTGSILAGGSLEPVIAGASNVGTKKIVNHGLIAHQDGPTAEAISLGSYGDTIVNGGHIVGLVEMLGGDDKFQMLAGGKVSGIVDMGDGDDTVTSGDHDGRYFGGAGDDWFRLDGTGKDRADGGVGTDDIVDYTGRDGAISATLNGSSLVAVKIDGVIEDKIANVEGVFGGTLADRLTGDSRANVFVGNGGKDTIDGGGGSDLVAYINEAKSVSVALNGSTAVTVKIGGKVADTIKNVENIRSGNGNDNLRGDKLANDLRGDDGNDTIEGGLGRDTLYGQLGNDVFVFRTALGSANYDVIKDFTPGQDKIHLDNAVMSVLGSKTGGLGSQFHSAPGATKGADANDHIIYNETTGKLYYDSNGKLAGGLSLIAVIEGSPTLAVTDLLIV